MRRTLTAPVRLLLPKNPWLRLLVVALPILVLLALFGPAVDVLLKLLDLGFRVLQPMLETTVGRILLLLVAFTLGGALVFWLLRSRVATMRGEAVLGRHLAATARLVSHDHRHCREAFTKVARYRGPAPERYPHVVADASLKLARLALERDRVDEALGWLARVVERDLPRELLRSLLQLRCRVLVRQGKVLPETLGEEVAAAVARFPDDAVLLAEWRDLQAARGDLAATVDAQERLVEAVPPARSGAERQQLVHWLRRWGEERLAAGDEGSTRRIAKRLQRLDPSGGSGGILLGEWLARQGDVRGAAKAFGSTRAPAAFGHLAGLLDRHPGSLEPRELLELCPLQGTMLLVARELARQGRRDDAERAARMAAETLGPTETVCEVLAEVLALLGRDAQARLLREQAVARLLRG